MQGVLGVLLEAMLSISNLSKVTGSLGRGTFAVCAEGWMTGFLEGIPKASAAKQIILTGQVPFIRAISSRAFLIVSVG